MPVRQMPGEVVRAKHRQHPVRTVAQRGGAVRHPGMLLTGAGVVRLHRYTDFIDHRRHFGCCLPARLAGFAGNDAGQLCFIGLQQRSKFLNQRLALGEWPFRPCRKRAACSLAGLLNLPGAGVAPRPEHLLADRVSFCPRITFARYPVTVNP